VTLLVWLKQRLERLVPWGEVRLMLYIAIACLALAWLLSGCRHEHIREYRSVLGVVVWETGYPPAGAAAPQWQGPPWDGQQPAFPWLRWLAIGVVAAFALAVCIAWKLRGAACALAVAKSPLTLAARLVPRRRRA